MARSRWLFGVLAAVLVASLVTGVPGVQAIGTAQAASTFVVDTTEDVAGDCSVAGECSLRAAVGEANKTRNAVIEVPPGTYALTSGSLRLTAPMTVVGAGAPIGPEATVVDAGGGSRVIDASARGVTLRGLVITGGTSGEDGGGVLVADKASVVIEQSTLVGNVARSGGAVYNRGSLVVERTTFSGNEASDRGGAVRNDKQATLVNVTVVGNSAGQGSALSSGDSMSVTHATVTRNIDANNASAAVDKNGGTLTVTASVLDGNLNDGGAAAQDCSGNPALVGVNLVGTTRGCSTQGTLVQGDPLLGPLTDNGGPTETVALLEGSAAIDAITGSCAVAIDQRGTARPTGAGCDLGAYEAAPLAATFSLDVDTTNYAPLTAGTVEVGAVSVPLDLIQDELVSQSEASADGPADTALRSIALRSIPLRSIDLESAPLRSIPLRSIGLEAIALRSIPLRSIDLEAAPLRSILLSEIPLRSIEGGWEAFLAGTGFAGLPLQSVTLEDLAEAGVSLGELTLADIGLEASPLRSIALRSILLADAPLRSIPLSDDLVSADDDARIAAWCEVLGDICGDTPGTISAADLGALDLLSAQLAGVSVEDVPVFDIPLTSLASTPLRSIPLRSIPLRSIEIANTPLRSIPLRSIALRSIDGTDQDFIDLLVDCGLVDCSTEVDNTTTLDDAIDAGALNDAELGVLLDSLADVALGCTSTDRDEIGEQACAFVEGLSFGDLLLAFVAPDDVGWESLDLDSALLQNIGDPLQPTFDYVATIGVTNGPADLDVELMLPTGFAAARAGSETAEFDGLAVDPLDASLTTVRFTIPDVGNGTHELRVPVRAGLETGDFTAVATLDAKQGDQGPGLLTDDATVTVVEAFEDDSPGVAVPLTISGDEDLQLAHISRGDDVDLYSFEVPSGLNGAQARLLLSNVPSGVDYDLAVYAPATPPLRGEPTQTLDGFGDIGFDLAPVDDVFDTDVVDDIQLDIPSARGLGDYTVRDTSTRRSNEDEEVGTGPLVGGQTYYVAVTSYNAGLSSKPYGLRIRVDGAVDLPTCAAPRFTNTDFADPLALDVPTGANTLYVTNSQWLDASGVDVAAVVAAIEATAGINGVVPGIVPVDSDPEVAQAYASWNAARCDPQARNAVVTEIGQLLDGLVDDDIENIVIVGGDGVVPMAAVPDLTEFSNESTFAGDTTFGGVSNELTGALGNGYLLSDDPYATPAGISVQNGDHELFLPELSIGRLVETEEEILTQLTNFVTYEGRLDGATAGDLAAGVTGYDFLDDGSEAVASELDALDPDGTARLISAADADLVDKWDRSAYLAFVASEEFQLLSPNAHYDFESLLPAADDGQFFTEDDLVTTSDVDATDEPLVLPSGALIFTMGCHAGLSVDDVQVGASVPDWAQTYAGDNVYAAHTTYGYGDTEIVAYSERLSQIFARNVAALANGDPGAPASIGQALRDAKREYLETTLVLTPYDEKILQSMTHYGMPMFRIGGESSPTPASAPAALTTLLAESSEPVSPVTFGAPDDAGVTPVSVELTETTGSTGPSNLNLVGTPNGDYYEVGGNVVAAQYRPVQPLVQAPVPASAASSGGLLITGLTSRDLEGFDPLYLQPTIDLGLNEGRIEPGDGSFPASLQRIAPGASGFPDRLLIAAGQFQDLLEGPGVQRIFTSVEGDLYPAVDTPTGSVEPPRFSRVIGRVGDDEAVVQFDVTTDDSAERVYVLFREVPAGGFGPTPTVWRGLDLARAQDGDGQDIWIGGDTITDAGATVEFFVQAVGANGRVGITDNKVYNYLTSLPDESDSLTIDLDGPLGDNGYYTGDVIARVTNSTMPETVTYSVDSGPFLPGDVEFADGAPNGVRVTGNGGHVVLARDDAGGREFVFFVIDRDGPTVQATQSPAEAGAVSVSLTAADVGQSGVASITYTVTPPDGGQVTTTVDGTATTAIVVNQPGTTIITAFATDRAGNVTPQDQRVTIEVVVDDDPPSVTATVDPAAAEAGWVNTDVTVTVDATDDSGVASITIDGTPTTIDPPTTSASATATITADGEYSIPYFATDVAGNTSGSASIRVGIDKTKPTAAVSVAPAPGDSNGILEFGEPAVATYNCDDALSGVESCVVKVDGVVVPDANSDGTVSVDTSTMGTRTVTVTATDRAGNTATASATYTVPYRVCLQYDPDQPKTIGSNYTIKLYLCDAAGTNVGDRKFTLTALSIDGVADPGPNDSGKANAGYLFRYSGGSFIYNLDTTGLPEQGIGSGSHYLEFEIRDPDGVTSTATAPFTLS